MKSFSRYVILIAVIAVAGFLFWYFSNILTYILIAAGLSLIGKPVVSFFRGLHLGKHRLPDWLCALLSLLCLVSVFVAFLVFFIPILTGVVSLIGQLDRRPPVLHRMLERAGTLPLLHAYQLALVVLPLDPA